MIKKVNISISIITLVLLSLTGFSQVYEFRFYGGANYYQGDLAPTTSALSYSQGKLAWAAMAGVKVNEIFKVNIKYMNGQLVGRDSDSKLDWRNKRNLNFASPIYELGLNLEFNINRFLPALDKYGVRLYYTTGINVFHFNPKTFKLNDFGEFETIELQPLGTEGQGLPGYKKPYSLVGINIPFGLGLRFSLTGQFEMGLEVVPRITFTDYIDDVSGDYVPYNVLIDAGRPHAAMLANRRGEYFGVGPEMTNPGAKRGNPDNNDWYMFSAIYVSYNFGPSYVKPIFGVEKEGDTDLEVIELENFNNK